MQSYQFKSQFKPSYLYLYYENHFKSNKVRNGMENDPILTLDALGRAMCVFNI